MSLYANPNTRTTNRDNPEKKKRKRAPRPPRIFTRPPIPSPTSVHDLANPNTTNLHNRNLYSIPVPAGERRVVRIGSYKGAAIQDFVFWRVGIWPPPPKEGRPGFLQHAFITRTDSHQPNPIDGDRYFYTLSSLPGSAKNLDPLMDLDKRIDPHARVATQEAKDPFCFYPENHQALCERYGETGSTPIGPIIDPLTAAPGLPAVATERTEHLLFPDPGQWWCRKFRVSFNKFTGLSERRPTFPTEGSKSYLRLKAMQDGRVDPRKTKAEQGISTRQMGYDHDKAKRVEEVIYFVHEHPGCINKDLLERLYEVGCTNINLATEVVKLAVETGLITRERDNNKIRFMPNTTKKTGKKKKGKKKA